MKAEDNLELPEIAGGNGRSIMRIIGSILQYMQPLIS